MLFWPLSHQNKGLLAAHRDCTALRAVSYLALDLGLPPLVLDIPSSGCVTFQGLDGTLIY